MLDLASWTWRQVQYGQGAARPARRAFHSATAVEGRVLLFGGAARREGAAEVYYQACMCVFMCVCACMRTPERVPRPLTTRHSLLTAYHWRLTPSLHNSVTPSVRHSVTT